MSTYLADFAGNRPEVGTDGRMIGSYGLELRADFTGVLVRLTLRILESAEIEDVLVTEAAQILIFVGLQLPSVRTAQGGQESNLDEDIAEDLETSKNLNGVDLLFLFKKLSHILRGEVAPKSIAINSKAVAMEVLEAVCRRRSLNDILPAIKAILAPLHHLTDPSIPVPYSVDELFKTKHDTIKTRAQVLLDSLQKKLGTTEYTKQMLAVMEEVKQRRQYRSGKRKIEAVAQPEKYGRDKRKRFERKRETRKIRSEGHKTMRREYKGW
jgi:U3 small nucleolar RNA-associated protein 20